MSKSSNVVFIILYPLQIWGAKRIECNLYTHHNPLNIKRFAKNALKRNKKIVLPSLFVFYKSFMFSTANDSKG